MEFSEHAIKDLLSKVKIFEPDLGEYRFHSVTEQFSYHVTLSNGTLQFSANELSANQQQSITKEQLIRIASGFTRTGPQRRRETIIPGDYSNSTGNPGPKKQNYTVVIIALTAAVVMGVAGAVFVLIGSPESENTSYKNAPFPTDSLNNTLKPQELLKTEEEGN